MSLENFSNFNDAYEEYIKPHEPRLHIYGKPEVSDEEARKIKFAVKEALQLQRYLDLGLKFDSESQDALENDILNGVFKIRGKERKTVDFSWNIKNGDFSIAEIKNVSMEKIEEILKEVADTPEPLQCIIIQEITLIDGRTVQVKRITNPSRTALAGGSERLFKVTIGSFDLDITNVNILRDGGSMYINGILHTDKDEPEFINISMPVNEPATARVLSADEVRELKEFENKSNRRHEAFIARLEKEKEGKQVETQQEVFEVFDKLPLPTFNEQLQVAQAYLQQWGKAKLNADQIKELIDLNQSKIIINWFEVTAEARLEEAMVPVKKLLAQCPKKLRQIIEAGLPTIAEFKKLLKRSEKQLELIYKVYQEPHVQLLCLEITSSVYIEAMNANKIIPGQRNMEIADFPEEILNREDESSQMIVQTGVKFKANIIEKNKAPKALPGEDLKKMMEERIKDFSQSELAKHKFRGTGVLEYMQLLLDQFGPENLIDDNVKDNGTFTMLNKEYDKKDKLLATGYWSDHRKMFNVASRTASVSDDGGVIRLSVDN